MAGMYFQLVFVTVPLNCGLARDDQVLNLPTQEIRGKLTLKTIKNHAFPQISRPLILILGTKFLIPQAYPLLLLPSPTPTSSTDRGVNANVPVTY